MEDLLPDITIAVREMPFSVLDRIRVIAENAGLRATVEPWGFTEDTGRMLVLTPATVTDGHEGLIIGLAFRSARASSRAFLPVPVPSSIPSSIQPTRVPCTRWIGSGSTSSSAIAMPLGCTAAHTS